MLQLHQNSSFQTNKLSTGRSPVPSLRSPQGPLVHSPLSPDLPRQPTSSISQTPSERAPALQQSPRSIFIPHRSVTDDRLPAPVFKSRPVPQQRPGSSEQSSQGKHNRDCICCSHAVTLYFYLSDALDYQFELLRMLLWSMNTIEKHFIFW